MEGKPMSEKKTITLPSGATAVFKDPTTLRVKDRKKVLRAANGEEGLLQAMSIIDGLIAILVEEWSFDMLPPAVAIKSLEELTMADYDALSAEASKAQDVLFPALAKNDEAESNPDSPFGNSND